MALRLCCDGCEREIPVDTKPAGVLERVYYCPDCRATYAASEAALDTLRVKMVRAFQLGRAAILGEARKALQRLPDE